MVQIHEKYEPQGVLFLGLTARSHDQADAFADSFGITWPNQYGIRSLAAAAPVIYVVGRDGRIVWSDERSRWRHDVKDLRRDIEDVLDRELSRPTNELSPHRGDEFPGPGDAPHAAG
ncbi:MAG TPA: hypothetical protein VHC22_23160 [Pirellulales bacterium]|nr:hypothetical protein [Pirellulales bacterium]